MTIVNEFAKFAVNVKTSNMSDIRYSLRRKLNFQLGLKRMPERATPREQTLSLYPTTDDTKSNPKGGRREI